MPADGFFFSYRGKDKSNPLVNSDKLDEAERFRKALSQIKYGLEREERIEDFEDREEDLSYASSEA
ncbi:MAG TPA: hypothetical protein VFF28_06055 [Candidatus Nanoarchaeia archaeon]|nr:hypothetical protein [Candidatus Nanoarchaeia archaeon]